MNDKTEIETPIQKAIRLGGNQTGLAEKLGVTQPLIAHWKKRNEVSAEYCPQIEKITGVRCELLCPSVEWSVVRNSHLRKSAGIPE